MVLDLRGLSNVADYFVICSATSLPHLKAVRGAVVDHLRQDEALKPTWSEGEAQSLWMVLDFVDVMVHVLHEDQRRFYGLEQLWSDAKEVEWRPADMA